MMAKKRASKKAVDDSEKPSKSTVHIRLENSEAVSSKRDILSSEMNLLKIIQSVQNYQKLRKEEMKLKRLIQRRTREVRINIGKLQTMMPAPKVPKLLEKEISISEHAPVHESMTLSTPRRGSSIENQLRDIQDKLNALQGRGEEE